jgi:hypothetical protein
MAAAPGTLPPNAGKGRVKGVPNKSTATVREAIALLAEQNIGRVQEWVNRVATRDPGKATELYLRLLEYHVPRLARTELSGEIGVRGKLVIDG